MARRLSEIESPYREALAEILSFSTFAEAEETILKLDALCRNYRSADDPKGVDCCRRIAFLGRRRAELIGRNMRVNPGKRMQKMEIAMWFRIWLETPAIFENWLAMRKTTGEFNKLQQMELSGKSK